MAYGSYPLLNYALLKIYTDDGLIGLGEAAPDPEVTGEHQSAVIQALKRAEAILIGVDPRDIEATLERCWESLSAFPSALAAIDMALHDLAGQALGAPVFRLLGGRSRADVALYPVVPLDTPEVMAETSRRFSTLGADVLKLKLGSHPDEDMRRLRAIRDAVGAQMRLRLDINQGWRDAATAIAAIRAMQGFNIEWVEQPVAAADLAGLAAVTASVDVPIMADEACLGAADVIRIACMRAADMINIKLMKCGGLLAAGNTLAAAQAAGLRCILGSMGESSIGSAAGIHFVTAKPGIAACEAIGPLFLQGDPAEGFRIDRATLKAFVDEAPGLGVHLK